MIIFKSIRYKNILSVGNGWIEIDLQNYRKTMLVGRNGASKSTLFSAITFALFGKPIKVVNKPALVNSINGKGLVVELEFDIGTTQYKIVRGIKPHVFSIYENGTLLPSELVLDQQAMLENKILKTNYLSFLQTSIISTENYTPFMQLSTRERRGFIEDVLDISVFSVMNQLLREDMARTREAISFLDLELKQMKTSMVVQKESIVRLQALVTDRKKEMAVAVKELQASLKLKLAEAEAEMVHTKDLEKREATLVELLAAYNAHKESVKSLQREVTALEKSKGFLVLNDTCPTCQQSITQEHKTHCNTASDIEIGSLQASIREHQSVLDSYGAIDSKLETVRSEIAASKTKVAVLRRECTSIKEKIDEAKTPGKSEEALLEEIATAKCKLKESGDTYLQKAQERAEKSTEANYQKIAQEMLKDSGIKAKIISQYIPVINKLVNKYLGILNFFVSFELDEEFNEKIRSRHRDDFTYFSFSAGERQRIDMALLFTFRQLAKMKNSFSCNLLALDEVMQNLDTEGCDLLVTLLDSPDLANTNTIIVSHKNIDSLIAAADRTIYLKKENGFSMIEKIEVAHG